MDAWSALADPTRRSILQMVSDRPRSVRELADRLPISRPAVSQHLKLLKEAGLVVDHAAGTRRIYSANLAGIAAIRAQLDRFWGQALLNFKQIVEKEDH
jgi:DNA-binding transcriptional ArsR family regulator